MYIYTDTYTHTHTYILYSSVSFHPQVPKVFTQGFFQVTITSRDKSDPPFPRKAG